MVSAVLGLVTLPLTWAVATGLTSSAAAETEFALELDRGHIDAFTLVWQDSQLGVQLQEDVTGHHILHDAGEVLLKVKEAALTTLPDPVPDSLAFLGDGGDQIYFLPQTQDPDLIWPGWSTERIPSDEFTNPMHIHIDSVDGPGEMFLWQTGAFGESTPVLDSGTYELPGSITVNVNAHVHANWAFTEPGRYTLTVHASGTRASGALTESSPATYTFDVGDPGASSSPDPTPGPTPGPTATSTPDPDPSPEPTTEPTPDPDPSPEAAGNWKVPNGHVNKAGATVLNDGHIDVASLLEGSDLVTKIKDTTVSSAPVWRDPAKTVLQLLPSSKATVPANSAYAFLGATGSSFYQVTQIQQPGLLWPGWSTESIPVSATTGGVLWALTDKSGPGEFAVYETDSFGQPTVLFNTRDGITTADRFTIPKNTHAHGSWAFSKEGTYCLSMQRVTELSSGTTVADQFIVSVAVGTADVTALDPAHCGQQVDTNPPVAQPPTPDDTDPDGGDDTEPDPESDGEDETRDGPKSGATECTAVTPDDTRTTSTVLSAGHIDYSSRIVGGKLASQIGDDTGGSKVYREPGDTILWLKPAARVTLPAGYGQIGPAGSVVWQVPQTQSPALIWLGWSTEQLNAGNTHSKVTWRLDKVEGPGAVKVYLSGSFGGVQTIVFSGSGSTYTIDLGVHAHANWAFSKQGIYRLTTTQSVTLANGKHSSDTEVLTIAVGDVDPTAAPTADGCVTTAVSGGSDTSAAATEDDTSATVSAAQVSAPAARAGISTITGSDITTSEVQSTVAPVEDARPVPLLLGILGGLLLLGAGGTGALWHRGAHSAPARTALSTTGAALS